MISLGRPRVFFGQTLDRVPEQGRATQFLVLHLGAVGPPLDELRELSARCSRLRARSEERLRSSAAMLRRSYEAIARERRSVIARDDRDVPAPADEDGVEAPATVEGEQ